MGEAFEDAAEGAEALEEGAGFGVAGADSEAEDEFEDLVVVECVGASEREAAAEVMAVAR